VKRERPILFSAPMVRAILSGTKTQTRRIVKYTAALGDPSEWQHAPDPKAAGDLVVKTVAGKIAHHCPYGERGGRLWVREGWAAHPLDESDPPERIMMRADGSNWWCRDPIERGSLADDGHAWKPDRWRPSIHMPRWASRIDLEILDVRVERLQDISRDDAQDEGIPQTAGEATLQGLYDTSKQPGHEWDNRTTPENFAQLWDTINGKRAPWASNPWVWVLTFKRIDAAAARRTA